jgi:hypothetical protein
VSDQIDNQTTGDITQPATAYVPGTTTSGRTSVAQDFDSLESWFSSDEFQQRLTNGFWEAKRRAIAERDRLLQSDQVDEGQS